MMMVLVFGFHRGGLKVSNGDIRMDYTKHCRRYWWDMVEV